MTRREKALKELDLEVVYEVYEDRDFVEVIGGQGGDVDRWRVYFDSKDEVTLIAVK